MERQHLQETLLKYNPRQIHNIIGDPVVEYIPVHSLRGLTMAKSVEDGCCKVTRLFIIIAHKCSIGFISTKLCG